jgi:hypothetical protein
VRFRCELRYHGEYGVEALFLRNGDLLIGRRFDLKEHAVRWADEERKALEKGWGMKGPEEKGEANPARARLID